MNFFFDENYGHKLAAGLDAFDEENSIKHFKGVGFLSTEDVEWFSRLPEDERNVIITLDRSISRNPAERSAWKESGAILFFLKRSFVQQTPWDQIAKMVKKWPTICKLAAKAKPGDGFIVHTSGEKIESIEL